MLTYENGDRHEVLEQKEWIQTWIDEATDNVTPRIWLIGDSIFVGITHAMPAVTEGKVLVDSLCSSMAADHPQYRAAVELFADMEQTRRVIVLNNGLHGWHLDDESAYPVAYDALVGWLRERFPHTPLYISLTTDVADDHRERVLRRNEAAKTIAAKHGCPVIDMYEISRQQVEHRSDDGVHFTPPGYEAFCRTLLAAVKENI